VTNQTEQRPAWKKWLAEGFGLGPFAYQAKLRQQLLTEIPFSKFSMYMREQLHGLMNDISQNLLDWLYDTAEQAKSEKETMELAQRIIKTWQKSEAKTNELLHLLALYPRFGAERLLRQALGNDERLKTQQHAKRLEQDIRDLKLQVEHWRSFAEWEAWQKHYLGYLVVMDKHLKRSLPTVLKTKFQRATVISAAMGAIGLKGDDSTEAILRRLRRQRGEKKRNQKTRRPR
jgi:hypothetical protein